MTTAEKQKSEIQEKRRIKGAMTNALLKVLEDPEVTTAQRLEATKILYELRRESR